MHQVKKAVIPVAGLGTRMLPATKAIPKEMLPIVDKPLIQYVVNEAVAAGIKEIVLVTHASKNAIENHFDTSFELEAQLENRLKRQLLEEVRSIVPKDVTVISVRQAEAKGLGHAISCARPVVGDNPFAVLLPDVLIDQYAADLSTSNLADMVRNFAATKASQIMVEAVEWDQVSKYGVVDCLGADLQTGGTAKIDGMIEKPEVDAAPSNMAVVGRYVLPAEIWSLLDTTQPGAGGEIQLTDAIDELLKQQTVEAYRIVGHSHDCGNKLGYMKAQFEYGLHHEEIGSSLKIFLSTQAIETTETA
ncbi:UTP--glucose-1-phosphate uridylyltransferase [Microbulbifer flavimaris]|uniref:UTP--glucose-1-phosphate uridylyltransferase n=1 Tax=Microbulbifer flavimaris TaxID=1781068 RepID=A0ABX4HX01_9GAMM|nr:MULTISPECIES: UTP--glucose-1-phosphate uridylyltransferase GalU [Microbulbifer]KUJ82436.1 UTP--glucose-1-phosphate uridylyltransferase [Microbulbifer sp. ZGT114]PCO04644.1 UTP--glucose-1-phosphate uridylyltransferase [Microbulbifer flavimaris]